MAMTEAEEKELKERLAKAETRLTETETRAKEATERATATEKRAQETVNKAKEYIIRVTKETAERAKASTQVKPEEEAPDFVEAFKEDPEGALDEHLAKRMGPLLAKQTEGQAQVARDLVRKELTERKWYVASEDGKDQTFLDVYGDALDTFMKDMPAASRSSADGWRKAVDFVRSQNLDAEADARVKAEISKRDAEAQKGALVEGPTAPSGSGNARVTARLDPTEMALMKELDMTPAEWLEYGGGDDGSRLGDYAEEVGE